MIKKIAALCSAACIMLVSFAACGSRDESSSQTTAAAYNIGTDKPYTSKETINTFSDPLNYTIPQEGEEIVVITVQNFGNVFIKLFPELVPDACENFSSLVKEGYYDGLTFHRVVRDFVIQGGDPEGTGMGGESIWGDKFSCEFSSSLLHLTGAVAYARASGDLRNGSQFYFASESAVDEATLQSYYAQTKNSYTQAGIDAYLQNGGQPYLDGDYTVFAQVFEGLDVLDKINQVKTSNDSPVNKVIIEKAQVVEYSDTLIEEMNAQFEASSADSDTESDGTIEPATSNDLIYEFAPAQNFTMPEEGEEIVVMTIKDYGEVKIKLFPELVPEACANFKGLVSEGYYDGLTFHRIIEDFVIQGGDPEGTGTGGEAYGGGEIPCEFSNSLVHFNGALAYARTMYSLTNQSQFYFVVGMDLDEETFEYFTSQCGTSYADETKQLYLENGGYPYLDGAYTVFGQIFEGLDVVMEISKVETDENNKPTEDVIIEKAEIVKYTAE